MSFQRPSVSFQNISSNPALLSVVLFLKYAASLSLPVGTEIVQVRLQRCSIECVLERERERVLAIPITVKSRERAASLLQSIALRSTATILAVFIVLS